MILAALTDQDSPTLLYLIAVAIIAAGPALHSWIQVFQYFRGQREDMSQFVTRSELAAIRAERDAQIKETVSDIKADVDRIETKFTTIMDELRGLHRSLGRVEGHEEAEDRRRSRPR